MSFKDLISNLSDQSIIKAVSKPVPKKIISCIGKNSLTASEISERISFPKEKIYYHLKKLVAFEILVVSEKEEIKGIVQKKYRLVDYPSTISSGEKKLKLVDHVNFKDLPLKTLSRTKYKTNKFDYVKAMARKIMGSDSNNDIIIQKYETDNKIRKLDKYIIKTKNEISIVKEKIDLIITQISFYDDNEKIYDNQKKLLQENESFSKRISNYKNSVISSKDKILIINKNYNDEKNKRNNTLNDLLKKIEKVEKELLIQSNKKDQVESYIK
ncbi:helix-turn-helix transcriptional regulator, partial [bacterium]|nr:helix-turn-helix transcriptional regulator [bacterium]